MSLLNLLDQFDIGNLDKNEKEQFLDRKQALRKMSSFSRNLAIAALPLGAVSVLSNTARAQSTNDIVDVLNFALTLEFLEYRFYEEGLNSGVIAGEDEEIFRTIEKHEEAHTQFLQDTINSLGGTPVEEPGFDFTAGGTFDPFNDYAQFLALSQAFEDTGVRAYKGQAGNVQSSDDVLTAALRIHSVEARHASQVRRLRTKRGLDEVSGWITCQRRGTLPEATQPVYNGENNTVHAGVEVQDITDIEYEPVTEAWDEPLSRSDVESIASLFIEQ